MAERAALVPSAVSELSLSLAERHSTELQALAATARDFADAGKAANTSKAYAHDWLDFSRWCISAGLPCDLALGPVDSRVVALYVTARAKPADGVKPLSVATLDRRICAIRSAHREAGHEAPDGPELRGVVAGVRRQLGRPPRKKRALVTDDLRRVLQASPNSLAGLRERALLLVGFAGAMRRSELVAMTLDGEGRGPVWFSFVTGGVEVHIDRSKADQEGRGAVIGIPHGTTVATCPVRALKDWLAAAAIHRGPVFRSIDRLGRVGRTAISTEAAAQIVKAAVERVGLAPQDFAGHSLRSGLATSAAAEGADLKSIMGQGRWAKTETAMGYIREADRFSKRNAARVAGL